MSSVLRLSVGLPTLQTGGVGSALLGLRGSQSVNHHWFAGKTAPARLAKTVALMQPARAWLGRSGLVNQSHSVIG
jgi:hypothetical protein